MPFSVHWSDQLELLADGLLHAWEQETAVSKNPLAKICVLVNDSATEHWLKQYFLLDRKIPHVLLNLAFVRLPEFANDWLEAQTRGISPRERQASLHPYSKEVLSWRIYRILKTAENDVLFDRLHRYIGSDKGNAPRRRMQLAIELARLYDDYLNSRPQMLRNWELGRDCPDDWQATLYRRLVAEDPNSYAADYTAALLESADAALAFGHGFPRYISVHLFDIPFLPEPTLRILEKVSTVIPMTFWTFNPLEDWLGETPSRRESIRRLRQDVQKHRAALRQGNAAEPPSLDFSRFYDSPEERLLGALASGARALIGAQCDDSYGDVATLGPGRPFAHLHDIGDRHEIALHRCFSARRELEALKDGLELYFTNHPDARPHDALVLCADWEHTAPIIQSVFGSDPSEKGYIPVTVAGGSATETPLLHSFKELLAFRDNRFEASAVFSLLNVPSIQARFGLNETDLATLQEMVRSANIHWGFDDADVLRLLKLETPPQEPFPFTWQRGLDRLALNLLQGAPGPDSPFVHAGELGVLLPCGEVEGERAALVAALWSFVTALNRLRKNLLRETAAVQEWKNLLEKMTTEFYMESEETVKELTAIRNAILAVAGSAERASLETMEAEVFLEAVLSSLDGTSPSLRASADAVLFSPLKSSAATPHRLVWLCGLNDGTFPRNGHRLSFDIIGKHPSVFDTTPREKDAFALLKAVLAARESLALSYVGQDIRTNEKIQPSVLLDDLLDYFRTKGIPVTEYTHPLQAYSPRYFQGEELPPSFSPVNRAVAGILAGEPQPPPPQEQNICAFELNPDGPTVIPLDELADFFAQPNRFLLRNRLGIHLPGINKMDDSNQTSTSFTKRLLTRIWLENLEDDDLCTEARILVEQGNAPDLPSAYNGILGYTAMLDLDNYRRRLLKYASDYQAESCIDKSIVDGYHDFLEHSTVSAEEAVCHAGGHEVHLPFSYRRVSLRTRQGDLEHLFYFEGNDKIYPSTLCRAWIRHLAGHAAGLRFATVMFCQNDVPARTFRPMSQEDALARLAELLELATRPLPADYPDYDKARSPKNDAFSGEIVPKPISTNAR